MSTHSHHNHNIDFKKAFTVTSEPKSQVKISGEIPYEELLHERASAIKALGQYVSLDGFRKGHIPVPVLEKHLGESAILAEMAERTISHMYPHILEAHNIDAIGYPKIEVTKIAVNNPLGFTATVAIIPEVTLPNYKEIAAGLNATKASTEVTEEEVEKKIKEILTQKAAYERLQQKAATNKETEGEEVEVKENTPETEEAKEDKKPVIPELTDEVAKTLGQPGQFTDVADFKTKLKEHLEIEKKQEVSANHRASITDAIIEVSTVELPQLLIDSELHQMFAQMKEDLKRANLTMDAYLTHIKKTKEELTAEWSPSAEKRAKLQLILNEIAKKEKIEAEQKAVDDQVAELIKMYKDADEMRVRTYVTSVLTNEAVMKMLEETKK